MSTRNSLKIAAIVAAVTISAAEPAWAAKPQPFTVRAHASGIAAKLTGVRQGHGALRSYRKLRVQLHTDNRRWSKPITIGGFGASDSSTRPTLELGDLNGDGVTDAWVTGFTGGAHCCTTLAPVLSTTRNSWKKAKTQVHLHGFQTRDLDGDGRLEVLGDDGRFDYAFTAHAGSSWPVVVQHATGMTFRDVSRNYPALLRADADELHARWQDVADDAGAARAALAAGLADLLRLDALDEARAWVAAAQDRGDLIADAGDEFVETAVGRWLVKLGYLKDFSVIGLPR